MWQQFAKYKPWGATGVGPAYSGTLASPGRLVSEGALASVKWWEESGKQAGFSQQRGGFCVTLVWLGSLGWGTDT